tara:strand:- start:171 stop:341 length:171 start_codon:yes stop_codon:yes gene_type:complete
MTYEEAKAALTENLEKFRVAGDVKAFYATLAMRNALIEDGDELTDVAEEYIKLFGK